MKDARRGLLTVVLAAALLAPMSETALAGHDGPRDRNGREALFSIVPDLVKTVQRNPTEIVIPRTVSRQKPKPPDDGNKTKTSDDTGDIEDFFCGLDGLGC